MMKRIDKGNDNCRYFPYHWVQEESSKADEQTQRQKELADCRQEVARLSLKGGQVCHA